jgi:signal transduction histidine kinase
VNDAGGKPGLLSARGLERHEWDRWTSVWHLAFWVLAAIPAAALLVGNSVSPVRRYVGLAVLAAACGWYGALGRRVVHAEISRAGLVYVTVAIPLTIGLSLTAPFGGLLLGMLYPHIWMILPPRRAVAGSAVASAGAAVAVVGWNGFSLAGLLAWGVLTVVFLLVSTAIGLWIDRIIQQSMTRAALIAELDATRAKLAEASRAAGAAAERERLACDIHDTLTQGFASILLLLDAAEADISPGHGPALAHLRNARRTAQENIAEARAMITALSPPHLRHASLPEALRQLVDRVGPELGAQARLTVTGEPCPLATDEEVVLLRAAQEALVNVRRHATAGRVDVNLAYRPGAVTLRVADDGRGFDPGSRGAGFGLDGMRARVAPVDGTLLVQTAPGAGTTIRVDVVAPVPPSGLPPGPVQAATPVLASAPAPVLASAPAPFPAPEMG